MFFSTFDNILNSKIISHPISLMDMLGHNNNVTQKNFYYNQNYRLDDNDDDQYNQKFNLPIPPPIKNLTDQEYLSDNMITTSDTHRVLAEAYEQLTDLGSFNFNHPINHNVEDMIQSDLPKEEPMTNEPHSEDLKSDEKDSDDEDEDYQESGPYQSMPEENGVGWLFDCTKDAHEKLNFSEALNDTIVKNLHKLRPKRQKKISKCSKDIKKAPITQVRVQPTCEFCHKVFLKNNQLGGHVSRAHPGMSIKYEGKTLTRQSRTQNRSQLGVIRAHILRIFKEI